MPMQGLNFLYQETTSVYLFKFWAFLFECCFIVTFPLQVRRMNDPDIRVLPVGSVCGHGTAESMAKFHAILGEGGSWQGKQLLSRATVEQFQKIKSAGFDLAFSMDGMWSYGMMIFPVKEQGKPVSHRANT